MQGNVRYRLLAVPEFSLNDRCVSSNKPIHHMGLCLEPRYFMRDTVTQGSYKSARFKARSVPVRQGITRLYANLP